MSTPLQEQESVFIQVDVPIERRTPPPQPKSVENGRLPREHEKEKIKRQLYNLIDRVDKL